ncbi:hypothetical protein NQ315_011174 [Exocentrus adspersus]|uniref:Uncharacterized protein n=1 Tax=Exocentrus adspersus TaxID=1586481 RepID=A0AAV8VXU0_9CUCU|nr:hypothetical protein NQ315_011174 [Exocentrus adspersus]
MSHRKLLWIAHHITVLFGKRFVKNHRPYERSYVVDEMPMIIKSCIYLHSTANTFQLNMFEEYAKITMTYWENME